MRRLLRNFCQKWQQATSYPGLMCLVALVSPEIINLVPRAYVLGRSHKPWDNPWRGCSIVLYITSNFCIGRITCDCCKYGNLHKFKLFEGDHTNARLELPQLKIMHLVKDDNDTMKKKMLAILTLSLLLRNGHVTKTLAHDVASLSMNFLLAKKVSSTKAACVFPETAPIL